VRGCLLGVPQLAWTLRRPAVGSGRAREGALALR